MGAGRQLADHGFGGGASRDIAGADEQKAHRRILAGVPGAQLGELSLLRVNGDLFTLLNGSTLNVLNGALLKASGGSSVFVSGGNMVSVANDFCPCTWIGGIPVALGGG